MTTESGSRALSY